MCEIFQIYPSAVHQMADVNGNEREKSVDTRLIMTMWARGNGIILSEVALHLFFLRALATSS